MNERGSYSGRLGAKMNGGLGIPHHSQEKIERGQIRPFCTDHYMIFGFGCRANPGIRIWALLRIVGGDTTPICVERVLCPVATCKFWVYERQYCLGCREALS